MNTVENNAVQNPFTSKSTDSKSALSNATASTDFNSFLTLLTSQLRNQDPLNPQDSTQFVSQLATFSSVEQQIESNRLLESISASLGNNDLVSAAGAWIGRTVEATTDRVAFSGDAVTLTAPRGAQGVARDVVVRDGAGNEVLRRPIGDAEQRFVWDGKDNSGLVAPQGVYKIAVETVDSEGKVASAPLAVTARVDEARTSEGGVELVLANGARVAPSAVRAVVAGA